MRSRRSFSLPKKLQYGNRWNIKFENVVVKTNLLKQPINASWFIPPTLYIIGNYGNMQQSPAMVMTGKRIFCLQQHLHLFFFPRKYYYIARVSEKSVLRFKETKFKLFRTSRYYTYIYFDFSFNNIMLHSNITFYFHFDRLSHSSIVISRTVFFRHLLILCALYTLSIFIVFSIIF